MQWATDQPAGFGQPIAPSILARPPPPQVGPRAPNVAANGRISCFGHGMRFQPCWVDSCLLFFGWIRRECPRSHLDSISSSVLGVGAISAGRAPGGSPTWSSSARWSEGQHVDAVHWAGLNAQIAAYNRQGSPYALLGLAKDRVHPASLNTFGATNASPRECRRPSWGFSSPCSASSAAHSTFQQIGQRVNGARPPGGHWLDRASPLRCLRR